MSKIIISNTLFKIKTNGKEKQQKDGNKIIAYANIKVGWKNNQQEFFLYLKKTRYLIRRRGTALVKQNFSPLQR